MKNKYPFNEDDFSSEGIKKQVSILEQILESIKFSNLSLEAKRKAIEIVNDYTTHYLLAGEKHKKELLKVAAGDYAFRNQN